MRRDPPILDDLETSGPCYTKIKFGISAFLIGILISLPSYANPKKVCVSELQVNANDVSILSTSKKLIRLRYSSSVANRLARYRPNLAKAILRLPNRNAPKIFYRGIDGDLASYRPTGVEGNEGLESLDKIWLSKTLDSALVYAGAMPGKNQALIFEFELPSSLVNHSTEDYYKRGIYSILKSDLGNEIPFIRKIGFVSIDSNYNKTIEWHQLGDFTVDENSLSLGL